MLLRASFAGLRLLTVQGLTFGEEEEEQEDDCRQLMRVGGSTFLDSYQAMVFLGPRPLEYVTLSSCIRTESCSYL